MDRRSGPARPGPDAPPVGRSLFDHLFMRRDRDAAAPYELPFPFSALVQRLEDLVETTDVGGVQQVFIPLGRSLHRHAAAPEYFRFPRVIIGINGEPLARPGEAGWMLRERLFLGYQEKAEIIEVISYNADAGRFEFQVVRDYGPGREPRVSYSSRALCMSCHQNGGPIFPGSPWRETDANPEMRARIQAARPRFVDQTVMASRFAAPWGIDYATDQANYFASYQFLWREGCGADEGPAREQSIRCRGALLSAALEHRLTGGGDSYHHRQRYRRDFVAVLSANWQRRWPHGLLIRTADLPDRDPLVEASTGRLDPLSTRGPRAVWSYPARPILDGTVMRLSEFLSEADVRRIDAHLHARGLAEGARLRRYQSDCRFTNEWPASGTKLVYFRCEGPDLALDGRLYIDGTGDAKGVADRLRAGDVPEQRLLALRGEPVESAVEPSWRDFLPHARNAGGLGARTQAGHRLQRLRFEWHDDSSGRASLEVLEDYHPIAAAIDAMIEETSGGRSDALSAKPFRRRAVLQALHRHLGMPALQWCCEDDDWMAPIEAEDGARPVGRDSTALDPFYGHCVSCHGADRALPPGFLHGDAQAALRSLRQCAPRIAYRLAMWSRDADARDTSPMPPAGWLSRLHSTEAKWRDGDALAALRAAVGKLLDEPDRRRLADSLAGGGYDALPECLIASQ